MKNFILALVFWTSMVFGAPKPVVKPIAAPAPVEQTISNDDLKKTLEHIIQIARDQQAELDNTKKENLTIQSENAEIRSQNDLTKHALLNATSAQQQALQKADELQKQVNDVTNDRNKQAALKDAALDKVDVLTVENSKLTTHIHHLKWIICFEAVALAVFLALRFRLMTLIGFPYNWLAMAGGAAAVFGLVWLLI